MGVKQSFVLTKDFFIQCSKYLLARRPAASNFSVGPVTLKTCWSVGLVTFFKHFFRHHTYCRLSQIYHLLVHLTQNRTAAKSVQYNKTLPSGQDIRHGPIRLNCSWPLPKKQTKRQSIWNTYCSSRGKGVDVRAWRKKVVKVSYPLWCLCYM